MVKSSYSQKWDKEEESCSKGYVVKKKNFFKILWDKIRGKK